MYEMVGTSWLFNIGNKYYITHDFGDDVCDLADTAFPIDELIAEQICKLCNKGYITQYSCSGHPFGVCSYNIIDDENLKKQIHQEEHIAVCPFAETDAIVVCDMDDFNGDEIYISFKEKIFLDTIPEGWEFTRNSLRKWVPASNSIQYYRKMLDAVEILDKWIETLPDINENASKKI